MFANLLHTYFLLYPLVIKFTRQNVQYRITSAEATNKLKKKSFDVNAESLRIPTNFTPINKQWPQ